MVRCLKKSLEFNEILTNKGPESVWSTFCTRSYSDGGSKSIRNSYGKGRGHLNGNYLGNGHSYYFRCKKKSHEKGERDAFLLESTPEF